MKDYHDRYAKTKIDYLLRRCEKYAGLTILAYSNGTRIDKTLFRRFISLFRLRS